MTRERILSDKELYFLKFLALPYNEIAERTGYAVGTVKTYQRRIFNRLNAVNRTHALFKAVKQGIITIEEIVTE